MQFNRTIRKNQDVLYITIPFKVVNYMGLSEGKSVSVNLKNDTQQIFTELATAQQEGHEVTISFNDKRTPLTGLVAGINIKRVFLLDDGSYYEFYLDSISNVQVNKLNN